MYRSHRRAAVAMLVALTLYVFSRTRCIRSDIPENELISSRVMIVPLQETDLSEAARVIGMAFANEAFTTTAFGGTVRQVKEEYEQAIELLLRSQFEAGQPVFTATRDDEVVGVAAISRPGPTWAPVRLAWRCARHPLVTIRLLGRLDWAGLVHVARTLRPPDGLPSRYYRLDAIGVAPAVQGEGVGGALLEETHDLVEHDPAASGIYLVTGAESTRDLYQEFGYVTVGTKKSDEVVAYHLFRPNEPDQHEEDH